MHIIIGNIWKVFLNMYSREIITVDAGTVKSAFTYLIN